MSDQLVLFKKIVPDAIPPRYMTPASAGMDFATYQDLDLWPHKTQRVGLGLALKIPVGHMLLLAMRSSIASKNDLILVNGVGIIDQDYCGDTDEIIVQIHNLSIMSKRIAAGTRIVQGILVPVTSGVFVEADSLSAVARGGFGSTGER